MSSHSVFIVGDAELTAYRFTRNGKPLSAKKIIVGENHVSFVTDKGELFSTRVSPGNWFCGRRWGSQLGLIKDAIALGVLPKKGNVEKLAALEEQRRKRVRAGDNAKWAVQYMANAGVALTVAQKRALQSKIKAGKR